MPLHLLDDKLWFPPVEDALPDGLLAMGADLSAERLLLAYRKGIFPWFEGELPLWWSPDPRFVLFPDEIKVSKSMKSVLGNNTFSFTINKAFDAVIDNCKKAERKDQDGTWITGSIQSSYTILHHQGIAISAEAWQQNQLVGGLYGILMKNIFFGESMFSLVSNASKFAFIKFVHSLRKKGVAIIDCQVYTQHLESLGARFIKREEFKKFLPE